MSEEVAPYVVFLASGGLAFSTIFRHNMRMNKAVKVIQDAYREQGIEWQFGVDTPSVWQLRSDPTTLFDESDSEEVREAKEKLVELYGQIPRRRAILIMLGGLLATVVAALVEGAIRSMW